jgi:hypothetical protein
MVTSSSRSNCDVHIVSNIKQTVRKLFPVSAAGRRAAARFTQFDGEGRLWRAQRR